MTKPSLLEQIASALLYQRIAEVLLVSGFEVTIKSLNYVAKLENYHARAFRENELADKEKSATDLIVDYWVQKIIERAGNEKKVIIFPHGFGLEYGRVALSGVLFIVSRVGCSAFK